MRLVQAQNGFLKSFRLLELPVAVLELLSGAARARIIASDMAEEFAQTRFLFLIGKQVKRASRILRHRIGGRTAVCETSRIRARFALLNVGVRSGLSFLRELDLNAHDDRDERFANRVEKALEHAEGFALIFLLRLLLSVAAEVYALTQRVERRDVLAPELVDDLQQHRGRQAFPSLRRFRSRGREAP